jgi:endopolyphosphatase
MLGAEMSECDTPLSLVNATFQWINDNLKDKVDFVIWTGDSARHDNDEDIPRTERQIVDLNKMVVEKFVEVFGKDDNIDDPDPTNDFVVPIVPTFGNNDILPHNIFEPGPNRWTKDYAEIWRKFIPEAQRHSFARGGWFFTEVIPNKLAVFSLNTIYFFDSNTAVDGCDMKSEPGYEHMEWLRIQLQFLRDRGMKAIMIGHVPPARTASKQSWDETCWQKYSLWMRQYRDVVVTGIFGHMNIDHFMIQDAFSLKYKVQGELGALEVEERNATDPMFSIESKADYLTDLRNGWTDIPTPPTGMSYSELEMEAHDEGVPRKSTKHKESRREKEKKFLKDIGGKWAERYSLTLVSPSVVPNFYPTLRVVEYNITGLENERPAVGLSLPAAIDATIGQDRLQDYKDDHEEEESPINDLKKKHASHRKKKKPAKPPFRMPTPPSASSPPGPAYSAQPFTLTSYTQYFANLTFINSDLEKSGLTLEQYIRTNKTNPRSATKEGTGRFDFEVEYDTKTDKRYKMKDMTMRSYLDLAQRIAREDKKQDAKTNSVWDVLPDGRQVLVGTQDPQDIEESNENRPEEYQPSKKDKKEKKDKKHKKHHKHTKGQLWHTFIKRAFVMTKTDEDMGDFE